MSCFFQPELNFALTLLRRLRIPVNQIHPQSPLSACDGGLRQMLGLAETFDHPSSMAEHWPKERTVYKMADPFLCRYIYFRLPETEPPAVCVLGPYLSADLSQNDLLELAERLQIPMGYLPQLTNHYASLPVYHDPNVLFAIVYTLAQTLWAGSDFDIVDVETEPLSHLPDGVSVSAPIEQADILQQMQQIEDRYAYEDKLMEVVSKGLTHQAEILLSSVSKLNFQQRVPDPLRNQKNYCIICNTLLRKAAQRGGVHPFHIDKTSSQFARAIENAATPESCSALIGEMMAAYCRLVHVQTRKQYSPAIQKVMSYIDANLSGDLSLPVLAQLIQVTPSYLSTLFHRETQRTLAQHIAHSRMQAAALLLKTTHLQIQTIAQLCGFSDPNYFGKQFRKHYGVAPLQYQRQQTNYPPPERNAEK